MEKQRDSHNDILNALENIRKIEPREEFLQRLEMAAGEYVSPKVRYSRMTILSMAACFLFLLMANFAILRESNSASETELTEERAYNLIPAKSLYDE